MEILFTSLLLFFLPSQFSLHFWPSFSLLSGVRVDYLSPTLYLTDAFAPFFVYRFFRLSPSPLSLIYRQKRALVFTLIAFFLGILNIVFSLLPALTLYKYVHLLIYVLAGLYFYHRPRIFQVVLPRLLPISLLLICTLSWAQVYFQRSIGFFWYYWGERSLSLVTPLVAKVTLVPTGQLFLRPYSTFSHPNSFAGFLLVALVILYFLYQQRPSTLSLLSLIVGLFTLPLTFSRSIIALTSFVVLVLVINRLSSPFPRRLFVSLLVALPIFLSLSLFLGNPNSALLRLEQLWQSPPLSATQLLLGIGYGTYPLIDQLHQPLHHLPLLLIIELGLLLTSAVVFMASRVTVCRSRLPLPLILAWIVIATSSLLDHYWVTLPQNLHLVAVVLVPLTLHKFKSSS